MRIVQAAGFAAVVVTMSLTATGCATYRTISAAEPGSPKVYSGTRLNVNAIKGNETQISKFRADPPTYPLLDLPFSVGFDTLIFPLTFSVTAYEVVFR